MCIRDSGQAVDAGADDIDTTEEDLLVICSADSLESVQNALTKMGHTVISAQSNMVPATIIEITNKDTAKLLLKLLDNLENQDDVQNVFANFEMDQNWMAEYLG